MMEPLLEVTDPRLLGVVEVRRKRKCLTSIDLRRRLGIIHIKRVDTSAITQHSPH